MTKKDTTQTKEVRVKLNEKDHQAIKARAARVGISMGPYMRMIVLRDVRDGGKT